MNVRPLEEMSTEELQQKQEEIRFVGSQYAMNGCEPPEQLAHDFDAVCAELLKRSG